MKKPPQIKVVGELENHISQNDPAVFKTIKTVSVHTLQLPDLLPVSGIYYRSCFLQPADDVISNTV